MFDNRMNNDGRPNDPILNRRIRIARLVKVGKRTGYGLFFAALILFFVGFITHFSDAMTGLIIICLITGSIVLAPSIVFGYAVRSAHREDHDLGRL